MLSIQTILPDTLELLKLLSSQPETEGLRLVGGTSLALQYGHRQSVDLDFFGEIRIEQEALLSMVRKFGDIVVINRTKNILQLVINNIKVDFVNYDCYDWIDNAIETDGITLASPKDIAAMKINAIQGRGSKKDFVDIFVLLKHYTLAEMLNFYKQKYPEYSEYRALLSLTYFEDAENQDIPTLFLPNTWDEMKAKIKEEVFNYQK